MKTMIALLMMSFSLSAFAGDNCPDLSGRYSNSSSSAVILHRVSCSEIIYVPYAQITRWNFFRDPLESASSEHWLTDGAPRSFDTGSTTYSYQKPANWSEELDPSIMAGNVLYAELKFCPIDHNRAYLHCSVRRVAWGLQRDGNLLMQTFSYDFNGNFTGVSNQLWTRRSL